MMKDFDKKMDDMLRNRLEKYTVEPPERVWEGIKAAIPPPKTGTGRKIYLRWLAAAAAVLLAIVTSVFVFDRESVEPPQISETQQPVQTETIVPENAIVEQPVQTEQDTPVLAQAAESKLITPSQTKVKETVATTESEITETRRPSFFVSLIQPKTIALIAESGYQPTESIQKTEIAKADDLSDYDRRIIAANLAGERPSRSEEDIPAWKVGLHVSPGYSSHSASYSDVYANNMTYASDNNDLNLAGGFSVQYKTANRWRLESGMYYSKTGGNSGNALKLSPLMSFSDAAYGTPERYFNTGVTNKMGQLAMNSTAGVINFSHTPANAELLSMPEASLGLSAAMLSPGQFSQVFDFVEIPFFARYLILDSKLDIELMAGISANILAGNNVYMDSQGVRELVGSTQDISNLSFAGNTGIGVIYALGKNLSVSVEPRLSYYLNSINRSGDVSYKPWRIGVFTGLNYEF